MIPLHVMAILLAVTNKNSVPSPSTTTILDVCMSPGCVADGAEKTLQKLQALVPPGVSVRSGVCCSLCGNGPVVLCPGEKSTVKHRRVKDKKVIDLLVKINDDEAPSEELLDGYDMVIQANEAFARKDYTKAVALYESALKRAFRPAMELQAARDQLKSVENNQRSSTKQPTGLLWLVQARRNEASAKLALGDLDGSLFAAQASCNLSRNTCAESFAVLAEIYRKKGNTADELQALRDMFVLPVEEKDLSFQVASRRRELKFRLEKLERDLN